jgi:hypothetical protein
MRMAISCSMLHGADWNKLFVEMQLRRRSKQAKQAGQSEHTSSFSLPARRVHLDAVEIFAKVTSDDRNINFFD